MRIRRCALVGIPILVLCLPMGLLAGPQEGRATSSHLAFMEVRLNAPVKFSRLKPGDTLNGRTTRDVFSGYRLLAPRGSAVRLTVSSMQRRRRKYSNLWPWPVPYFLPKYQHIPSFDFAEVSLPNGGSARLPVAALPNLDSIHVATKTKARKKRTRKATASYQPAKHAQAHSHLSGPLLQVVLNAVPDDSEGSLPAALSASTSCAKCSGLKAISAGTKAELVLLDALSASKSRVGEPFKALLMQPLRLNSDQILPEGSVFEGRVTKRVPPRRLSRPGSLYVTFTRLVLPAATSRAIAASVAGVDVDRRSRIKVSSEGGLSGGSPGKVALLKELGVGVGISKVSDDAYQLIAEAFVSTATDASTAGTARLIGLALSGIYALSRHGRDVTLPPYTTITIRFGRDPLPLLPETPARTAY